MKKLLFQILFLIILMAKTTTSLSMEKAQSIWTPKTVISLAVTIGGLKLIHDGLQKAFDPNKKFFLISNSTWFSSPQGGKHKTQVLNINTPNTQNAQTLTVHLQRLSRKEEDEEFAQGLTLVSLDAITTFAGFCYLNS